MSRTPQFIVGALLILIGAGTLDAGSHNALGFALALIGGTTFLFASLSALLEVE